MRGVEFALEVGQTWREGKIGSVGLSKELIERAEILGLEASLTGNKLRVNCFEKNSELIEVFRTE